MRDTTATASPRVSILMPAYNAMPYLPEALDDLLGQTLRDFELVVVEDGSTDDTRAVLEDYAARDARVVIVPNEQNLGLTRSLNRGLERCRAPLVARADADDRYEPDRLARQVAFLDAHPEVGLLSCGVHKINARGERFLTRIFPTGDGHIRVRELFVNCFSHPGAVFRTPLVRAVGGYDPAFWTAEDCDLWARMMPLTRVANLPVPLVHYRKHGASMVQSYGADVDALDLSVRQRQISAYLGRPVGRAEAQAAVELFRGRQGLTPDTFGTGRRLLREVLRAVRAREHAETVGAYRRDVADALFQHARHGAAGGAGSRWFGLRLLVEAALWSPGRALKRDFVRLAARHLAGR